MRTLIIKAIGWCFNSVDVFFEEVSQAAFNFKTKRYQKKQGGRPDGV